MDINAESENIISSDEYSDEVDYDDDLMIDAIRAQHQPEAPDVSRHKQYNWRIDQKQKQISSLIRRNKISNIYKKKSIKWLNSKRQRERYRKYLFLNRRKEDVAEAARPELSLNEEQHQIIKSVASFGMQRTNFNLNPYNEEIRKLDNSLEDPTSLFITNHDNQIGNHNPKEYSVEKNTISAEENVQHILKFKGTNEQTTNEISRKRSRSKSPSALNQSNDMGANKLKSKLSQFYAGINDIFSKFENVTNNHINNTTNDCSKNVNEKMKTLSLEIDALNEILHEKERELNRLSHLKMVKEEMYFRLDRKRHALLLKEGFLDKKHQYSLHDLKELEIRLSDQKETSEGNYSSKTIQELIEKRADMNADDLKREKNNTNRLHSLLASQNMLHATELLEHPCLSKSGNKIGINLTNQNSESTNYINGERTANDIERLCDFGEESSYLFSSADKRNKLKSLFNIKQGYCYPLFEKTSRGQLVNEDFRSELFPLSNSVNEISITPIGCSKKLPSSLENVRMDERNIKSQMIIGNFDGKRSKNIQYPLCQECKAKESRFVCAGCGNQWYCSKNCQIMAWDTHSEICTE